MALWWQPLLVAVLFLSGQVWTLFSLQRGDVSRRWLRVGSVLFALQAILFDSSIAQFGQATAANVLYSSRGVWSVVVVALLGRWFQSSEKSLGGTVLGWRFFGASLMLTAIVLLLV